VKLSLKLEQYRSTTSSAPGETYGLFVGVPGPCGEKLIIVASNGKMDGWEHVSVSRRKGLPNWTEMCFVKNLFWDAEECVVQFHPRKSDNVSNYRVLHMWRPTSGEFPTPPQFAVGIKEFGDLSAATPSK
jgi:hypothetical protein